MLLLDITVEPLLVLIVISPVLTDCSCSLLELDPVVPLERLTTILPVLLPSEFGFELDVV